MFLSRDQRSLYNVDHLTGRPWWSKQETTYAEFFDRLESLWEDIRDEGVSLLSLTSPEGFVDEAENLRDVGDWKQYELYSQGRRNSAHCQKVFFSLSLFIICLMIKFSVIDRQLPSFFFFTGSIDVCADR